GVEAEVTTQGPAFPETAVFFNRAAAARRAFEARYPKLKDLAAATPEAKAARDWLADGLEDALLAFLGQAKDKSYALHAAVYEFQKPELLQGLVDADTRGAEVKVVYHHRVKNDKDTTASKNDAAIKAVEMKKSLVKPRQ